MSSNDSDSDPSLPHFETVVTIAVVEPDKSRVSSVNFTKCDKNTTNSKNSKILRDLDLIEVLSDHNNNQVDSISRDFSNVSYESFKHQLNQGNGTEELLHPLTSSRVQPAVVRKLPQIKKTAFKREPKPFKRGAVPSRIQYNIKKFNSIESSSNDDEDDFFNTVLKNNQKEVKLRSIKRGGPVTNKNQIFKKSKAGKNCSVELPEVKSKRHFVVQDIIGYSKNLKQDEDFWSLASLINPDPKPNDALETSNGEIDTQLENVLEDDAEISTKLIQTVVPGNLTGYAGNFKQDDDFSSLSSLDTSLRLNSNLKPIDESKTLNDKICVTSKPDVEDSVKTRTDCSHKTDEEIHSVQDVVDLDESTVDEFTEANYTKFMVVSQDESSSQGEQLELLAQGKLEKGGKEIFGWVATGIQEDQQDEIFKQAEWHLKEISKFIQIKLDMINGPIAVKNYKFYNFLLDLEDKLNTNFRENSDTEEQDFDDFM